MVAFWGRLFAFSLAGGIGCRQGVQQVVLFSTRRYWVPAGCPARGIVVPAGVSSKRYCSSGRVSSRWRSGTYRAFIKR